MGMIGNTLAQGLISGANIQDGTVDTPDIKDSAVTAAKIATGVVTPGKLSTGAPTWDSSSNIGIGTSVISTRVNVRNARSDTPGSGWLTWENASETSARWGQRVNTNSEYSIDFYSGSSWAEKLKISQAGDVGLGGSAKVGGGNSRWFTLHGTTPGNYSGGIVYALDDVVKGYHYFQAGFLVHQAASGVGHAFYVNNNTVAATIDTSNNLALNGNLQLASGKGIDFSASSNLSGVTTEVLDDYEAGSWTASISASSGLSGLTAGTHFYTKIGKSVTVHGNFTYTSATPGAVYIVLPVPFNHNTATAPNFCGVSNAYPYDNNRQSGIVIDNSSGDATGTYIGCYVSSSAGGAIYWSLTYQAA